MKMALATSSGCWLSGGARVIYAVVLRGTALALLDVYAKSERADITASERKMIAALIREIEAE